MTAPGLKAVAWVDGGSRGNPGEAGAGIVLDLDGRLDERHSLYLGRATNNEAEYAAVLAALERLAALGVTEVDLRSDSQLLVRQVSGQYRVKAEHLKPLWARVQFLASTFCRFSIRHVPRDGNTVADSLANQAMDTRRSTLPLPRGVRLVRRQTVSGGPSLPFGEEH